MPRELTAKLGFGVFKPRLGKNKLAALRCASRTRNDNSWLSRRHLKMTNQERSEGYVVSASRTVDWHEGL